MSGRTLGRLLGSLLLVAAFVGGSFVGDPWSLGEAKTMDIIWNMPAPR